MEYLSPLPALKYFQDSGFDVRTSWMSLGSDPEQCYTQVR